MHQTSIKEQLKPKPTTTKNNKHSCEENISTQKSPPNCESSEVKVKELKPEHEDLKQQLFAGIRPMLDPIKEDIEQIKLDQQGLESEASRVNLSGHKLKQQIIKNEEKEKKLEHRISALEDQLLEKNIIFQGLGEDEFDDLNDTKSKIISVLATVTNGATAEDKIEVAKKTPIN